MASSQLSAQCARDQRHAERGHQKRQKYSGRGRFAGNGGGDQYDKDRIGKEKRSLNAGVDDGQRVKICQRPQVIAEHTRKDGKQDIVSSGSECILLGMIARGSEADVNVISLVGERGRELREFVESDLGEEGMKKSIVVVSTSDQPAPMRIRASILATAIAEGFRNEGQKVLLLIDSLTRFAMAQREIGLASGEPPASRGYVPSVFSLLPKLLERTGTSDLGAITAIYTVLVEGDDMNEPVADAVRGFLDGHIVLSRKLANANHFPAIDVLNSVSRLDRSVCSDEEIELISEARDLLSLYHQNEDMINVGAYVKNSNPKIDRAIAKFAEIKEFLRQRFDSLSDRNEAFTMLKSVLK